MEKTKQKVSQEGWRTTKKERRNYIVGDLGRTLEGYIVTAMMSTFMIFQGIDMTAIAGAMLVVKIIDAFDDVIFGYLVDRIHITEWKAFQRCPAKENICRGIVLPFSFFPFLRRCSSVCREAGVQAASSCGSSFSICCTI